MLYRIILVSEEVDNFRREIKINTDATFADLHTAIMDCCGYSDKEMSSFFICDQDWQKEQEITQIPMGSSSDMDEYVMDETRLEDLIEEVGQQLIFVYDMLSERYFCMKVVELITRETLDKPVCILSQGDAPKQTSTIELAGMRSVATHTATTNTADELGDEDFYGDEAYNEDELFNLDEIPADSADLL